MRPLTRMPTASRRTLDIGNQPIETQQVEAGRQRGAFGFVRLDL